MSSVTYGEYLHVDELLRLPQPLTNAHDELLFIVAHQTAELWLKLLLTEFETVRTHLESGQPSSATLGFKRCKVIIDVVAKHFEVIDTMTPSSFAAFRETLGTASGAESMQFRKLGEVLGSAGSQGSPTLNDALHAWLKREQIKDETDLSRTAIRLSESQPEVELLFEMMTDFEESVQTWRFRHAMNAGRLIGNAPGTGGTTGAEHLRSLIHSPVFPTLRKMRDRYGPVYKK